MKFLQKNGTQKSFVLIYMFLLYCAAAQTPTKARIGFRVAKHICVDLEKLITTKQIQAPPTLATEFVSNDPCQELVWKKCASMMDTTCVKFDVKSCNPESSGSRIVGGIEAIPNEFPHQVRLSYPSGIQCSGAVLNENYIITAAHCIHRQNWRTLLVILGDHDTRKMEASEQTLMVEEATMHEGYATVKEINDIALLKLKGKIQFNNFVKPALMPPKCWKPIGKLIVSGWGRLRSGRRERVSPILMKVEVDNVPLSECAELYNNNPHGAVIAKTSLCAASPGKDACQGDSGGPLVSRTDNGSYILAGIVSFGIGCADPKFPGVYTRVSKYIDWIHSKAV